MTLCMIIGVAVFASPAFGAELCFSHAAGEGYDGLGGNVNAVGYLTSGEACSMRAVLPQTFEVSSSEVDPDVNSGPLSELYLFLWAITSSGYGFWNGYVDYEGSLEIEDVEPLNRATVVHDPPRIAFVRRVFDLDIRLPIARLTVVPPTTVQADTWGRIKAHLRRAPN